MTVPSRAADVPARGEHPAIDLVNTVFVRGGRRGRLVDSLAGPGRLGAWLDEHAAVLGLSAPSTVDEGPEGERALASFVALRDALRRIATAAVAGTEAAPEDVAAVNGAARATADWVELPPAGYGPPVHRTDAADPVRAAHSRVARAAVGLLTGPDRELLRSCPAPGCVRFYLRTHPRRAWCSTACGNRVRVARHGRASGGPRPSDPSPGR
ncbi:ABATE domain-containing protein [Nocardiopsis sp. NPDC049922]|uniref:CGNR zinc finger domain-containing protein n=1 Tax=Nocardiopsis sp. NPDC049922 TaxID=3155157 RepID=UPI0033F57278